MIFGARHYDPVLGRWMQLDPMALLSDDLSPYNYVENNPMNMVDPDGMQPNNGSWGGVPIGKGTSGGSWGTPGDFAGGAANFGGQFVAALDAFNINKPVIRQDWSQLTNVQGTVIKATPQATLSQWQPGVYDNWKNSGFLGKFTYDISDDAYIAVRSVFWSYGGVNHLNGEYATPRQKIMAFAGTAASFIPLGKGGLAVKEVLENAAEHGIINIGEKAGVYNLETTSGRYIGQSKNMLSRILSHFSSTGKFAEKRLSREILHEMSGSTKLEREVYEQYLLTKYGGPKGIQMLNKVNPMGGRMELYNSMIENVIEKYNLYR